MGVSHEVELNDKPFDFAWTIEHKYFLRTRNKRVFARGPPSFLYHITTFYSDDLYFLFKSKGISVYIIFFILRETVWKANSYKYLDDYKSTEPGSYGKTYFYKITFPRIFAVQ